MSVIGLPFACLRLEARVETPLRLPDYAGSMLRGAFGAALRRLACMTRQPTCVGCGLLRSCPYAVIFETAPPLEGHPLQKFSEVPRPYVVEAPEWGARMLSPGAPLTFGLVLFGRALTHAPLVLLAWHKALRRGLGTTDGTAQLLRVIQETAEGERLAFDAATGQAGELQPESVPEQPAPRAVTLEFSTPLRLQENGKGLGLREMNAHRLLMALVRRASLMAEFHGAGAPGWDFRDLSNRADAIREQRDLRWQDWARYSSRQQQKIHLGGLVGTWRLEGDLEPFRDVLRLGQYLHVGKEASFGLGRYRLLPDDTSFEHPATLVNPSCNPLKKGENFDTAIQKEP